MKHLAGEPRQSTCLTTDECRGCPNSRLQKVNAPVTFQPAAEGFKYVFCASQGVFEYEVTGLNYFYCIKFSVFVLEQTYIYFMQRMA
jgi:hypothetical protein